MDDAFLTKVEEKVRDVFSDRAGRHEHRRSILLRKLTLGEQRRNVTEQKLVAGVLTDAAYRRVMNQITGELEGVRRDLDALDAERQFDGNMLRQVLQVARDIPAAYGTASPQLQRRYMTFFYERFVVRDRRIIDPVPTPFFRALLAAQQVRHWHKGHPHGGSNLLLY